LFHHVRLPRLASLERPLRQISPVTFVRVEVPSRRERRFLDVTISLSRLRACFLDISSTVGFGKGVCLLLLVFSFFSCTWQLGAGEPHGSGRREI